MNSNLTAYSEKQLLQLFGFSFCWLSRFEMWTRLPVRIQILKMKEFTIPIIKVGTLSMFVLHKIHTKPTLDPFKSVTEYTHHQNHPDIAYNHRSVREHIKIHQPRRKGKMQSNKTATELESG